MPKKPCEEESWNLMPSLTMKRSDGSICHGKYRAEKHIDHEIHRVSQRVPALSVSYFELSSCFGRIRFKNLFFLIQPSLFCILVRLELGFLFDLIQCFCYLIYMYAMFFERVLLLFAI